MSFLSSDRHFVLILKTGYKSDNKREDFVVNAAIGDDETYMRQEISRRKRQIAFENSCHQQGSTPVSRIYSHKWSTIERGRMEQETMSACTRFSDSQRGTTTLGEAAISLVSLRIDPIYL